MSYGTKWMEGSTEPCRKYTRNEPEPTVVFEAAEPESIAYKYGACYITLTGFYAWLYRGMIWMYGEKEAAERFWFLFHKKSDDISPEIAASL